MTRVTMTIPRRQALAVLVDAERTRRTVREAQNTTSTSETIWCTRRGCGEQVHHEKTSTGDGYWTHTFVADQHDAKPQPVTISTLARAWLETHGHITSRVMATVDATGRVCRLTKAGRELAKAAGIR